MPDLQRPPPAPATGFGDQSLALWDIAKWPFLLAVVVLMVAVLYYATPNVQQPKFRWVSVGAAVAIGIWVIASLGFGFYVTNFAKYDSLYGSLGSIIVFLLWLWLTNLALLFGAEIDAELERARQLQAGIRSERTLQLPPRDDSGSVKRTTKLEERVAERTEAQRNALQHALDIAAQDGMPRLAKPCIKDFIWRWVYPSLPF